MIRVNNQLDVLFVMCLFRFIDTIDSLNDDHCVARNMLRSEINTLKKCVMLVINTNCTEMQVNKI